MSSFNSQEWAAKKVNPMKPQDLTPYKILGAEALPPDALRQAFVAAFADYLIGPL